MAFATCAASALAQPVASAPPPDDAALPSPAPSASASAPDVAARLPTLSVTSHYDNAIGTSDAASQGSIRAPLLQSRPALRPGEVLEFVPGLVVTQHSGDGKANQYFLRGFNLDHGTDFATSLAGMPLNMPTHGHGQGYTDLNLLIPELVERIDYRKGPSFAGDGDFASAGSADIVYRRALAPFGALTLGAHGFRRAVVGGSSLVAPGVTLLGAIEAQRYNGPWTVPERLRRLNGVATLSAGTEARGWSASLMSYGAAWTSTDQVPQRLIDGGIYGGRAFGRFDSLDPFDGGRTRRSSLSGEWHEQDAAGRTSVSAYAIRYRLELHSDFTYALERPAQGDQFAQQDKRTVVGLKASRAVDHTLGPFRARSDFGLQVRHDRIGVGLFDTVQRAVTSVTREDDVRETLAGVYGQTAAELLPWLRAVAGLRADQAWFDVRSHTQPANSGRAADHLFSPKLALIAGPWAQTEFFLNAGTGFHSNDARGTTATVNPPGGEPVGRVPGLVRSRGWELGARTELLPGLQSSLAFWHLSFDSELVYVGDAGTTEPNRPSRRRGIEWSNRWTPARGLLVDADLAWTHARFADDDPAGRRIPNSVERVGAVAVTWRDLGPWSASVQWRYLGAGALVEDGSVRSTPSVVTNLRVSRRVTPRTTVTVDVFNLLDRKFDDIQYVYASRLPGEAAPVTDRVVHAGEPRAIRVTLRVGF